MIWPGTCGIGNDPMLPPICCPVADWPLIVLTVWAVFACAALVVFAALLAFIALLGRLAAFTRGRKERTEGVRVCVDVCVAAIARSPSAKAVTAAKYATPKRYNAGMDRLLKLDKK